MSIREMADRLGVRWCGGGCGLSEWRHRGGAIDPFGVLHFSERRFTKRAARNFLVLAAKQRRLADPGYLNVPMYDWWYVWSDSRVAAKMARELGFVIPARLWDEQKEECRMLAMRRGIRLHRDYPAVWAWCRR